ncbi:MAG: ComEC/Rec2 family competence protein [Candidatus Pacebacteria bacterium]|nr:ComEC/Rec2 family competence protein [Candidatus Paceibacterota bacterium]
MTPSKTFIMVGLVFISGIFIGSFFHSYFLIYLLLIFSLFLIGILWKKEHVFLSVFLIIVFLFGYLYINFKLDNVLKNEITQYFEKSISLEGRVIRTPKDDLISKKAILEVSLVSGEKANILITTNQSLSFGDKVFVLGEVKEPKSFGNFNYKMYLANQGVSAIMENPEVTVLSENNFFIFEIKKKAEEITLQNLSINKAGILNATILGETDNMSSELKEKLGFTGISHVVAISGTHIVLLCFIMLSFLNCLKIKRRKAIVITFFFLLFYIVLIEFPASAFRAFIMMSFVLLAELLGRETDSFILIILAAILILFFNPLALVYDLGFQLSFLAVLGIIFFNNYFKEKLSFLKNDFLKDLVAVNFSAQVFVLPLLIYTFNYFSFSSLLANILIVPISTILLVFGFLCVAISLILPSFSFLFYAPLSIILGYVLFIVDKFSFMVVEVNYFPAYFLFIVYFLISLLAYKIKKERFEFYI